MRFKKALALLLTCSIIVTEVPVFAAERDWSALIFRGVACADHMGTRKEHTCQVTTVNTHLNSEKKQQGMLSIMENLRQELWMIWINQKSPESL